jgi:integrase
MTRGLYRRRKAAKNGKLRDTGAFIIDMKIKDVPEFAGMNRRLVKTTGVLPQSRDAAVKVQEMKLMVKELIRDRDAKTLRKIQAGMLSLGSVYKKWKEGRVDLAEQYEEKKLVKSWRRYLENTNRLAEKSKENRRAIIKSLLAKELIGEHHVVNDLPELMVKIRGYYEDQKQAPAFNTIRIEIGAFLTKGLRIGDDTPLYRAVMNSGPLPMGNRRDHHPFYAPVECGQFLSRLMKRSSPHRQRYASAIIYMCYHGCRPEEFERGLFAADADTGHLHIRGTKNENADRVVPRVSDYGYEAYPQVATLNRMFERMGSQVRCRDFRRTYAIWCEAAGIPASHIRAYMGHSGKHVTQRYQRVLPTAKMLDDDAKTLREWVKAELEKGTPKRDQPAAMSALQAMMTMVGQSIGDMVSVIEENEAMDAKFEAENPGA